MIVVEPSAAQVEAANQLRGMYTALVRAGFEENEALFLTAQVLNSGLRGQGS